MIKNLMSVLLVLFLSVHARAESPSPQDKTAFQAIISAQLEAFKKDDGATAYSYAAPVIKGIFPDVESFMAMVKRGYGPVYTNSTYKFGPLVTDGFGRPAQHVTILASNGKRYEAVYAMQHQPDGSWKIAACTMVEIPGLDA